MTAEEKLVKGNLLLEEEERWQRQADNPKPGTTEASTCLDTEQLSSAGAPTLQKDRSVILSQKLK